MANSNHPTLELSQMSNDKDLLGKPDRYFDEIKDELDKKAKRQYQNFVINGIPKYYQNDPLDPKSVEYRKNVLDVYKKLSEANVSRADFIDLKPYFENSPNVKHKKNGTGWYMIIPIGAQASILRSKLPRKLFDTLQQQDNGTYSVNDIANQLRQGGSRIKYGGSNTDEEGNFDMTGSFQDALNKPSAIDQYFGNTDRFYDWKSSNITRSGSSNAGHYTMFRTVSDKSDPNSWIVGQKNSGLQLDSETEKKVLQLIEDSYAKKVAKVRQQQMDRIQERQTEQLNLFDFGD